MAGDDIPTQNIELEYRLLPFIPDFIPAVGDIDAFIKVCFGTCKRSLWSRTEIRKKQWKKEVVIWLTYISNLVLECAGVVTTGYCSTGLETTASQVTVALVCESRYKGSSAPSLKGLVVAEERMRSLRPLVGVSSFWHFRTVGCVKTCPQVLFRNMTHTHLMASFSDTRKIKPIWILLEQETMVWQWHQLDRMKSSAPHSRQITTPAPHHSILQAGCSSWCPTNSVKALKAILLEQVANQLAQVHLNNAWYMEMIVAAW